jgi:hypothetical protein
MTGVVTLQFMGSEKAGGQVLSHLRLCEGAHRLHQHQQNLIRGVVCGSFSLVRFLWG